MNKTAKELQKQARKIGLLAWRLRDCSFCGYPLCFIFKEDGVYYDQGCDCTPYRITRKSNWEEVAQAYNISQPKNIVEWKFKSDLYKTNCGRSEKSVARYDRPRG